MNWNGIDGTWQRFKGQVREQWSLPDDDQPDGEKYGELTDMIQGAEHSAWDSESEDSPAR